MYTLLFLGFITLITSIGYLTNSYSKLKSKNNSKLARIKSEEILNIRDVPYTSNEAYLITVIRFLFEEIAKSEREREKLQKDLDDIKKQLTKIESEHNNRNKERKN